MKKTVSFEELKSIAREVFDLNPGADKVYATRTGQVFLPHALNAAQMHARDEGGDKPLKIYTITREEAFDESPAAEDHEKDDQEDSTDSDTKNDNVDTVDPDEGIKELIQKAVDLELIKKSGNFYSFGDQKIGQGIKQVVAALKENVPFQQIIVAEVTKLNV